MNHADPKSENDVQAWSPRPLFKYLTLNRAFQVLRTGEIRFTQPRFLNDPHELNAEINPQSLLRDFYEYLRREGATATEAANIATRNIVGMVFDRVEGLAAERERIGVLSLSDSFDNMLLWAHYGHEHRGAVLEIDAGELITKRSEGELQAIAEMTYSDARVDYIARRLPVWMTLTFKSEVWAYEREWRMFKSLSMLRDKGGDVFVADLPPRAIKRVIFGARAFGADEEGAIDLIQRSEAHRHIEIYKAVFSSDTVGLTLKTGAQFAGLMLHGQHHFGDHWREMRQWVDFAKMERAERGEGLPPLD